MRVVYDQSPAVLAWVAARIEGIDTAEDFGDGAKALGIADDQGQIVGGVVYHNWKPDVGCIDMSCASATPKWLTRDILTAIFSFPFVQLGCVRVTAVTMRRARATRHFDEKLGFRLEGVIRRGFRIDDACIYGMLAEEWAKSRFNTLRGERVVKRPRHRRRKRDPSFASLRHELPSSTTQQNPAQ